MADLSSHQVSPVVQAIESWRESTADREFRPHLGASLIGRSCDRALWLGFRWSTRPAFPGQVLRLFETGQLEEARFVRELRGIGCQVWPVDPTTGRQWRVSAHGHFGGSLDAVALGIPGSTRPHVVEMKTHNAKSFASLTSQGVQESKPEHYAQMCIYMHLMGIDRALYLACCKDTDALHAERLRADPKHACALLAKSERIIYGRIPEGISGNPEYYLCRWCDQAAVCHGADPERNCRTCSRSAPCEDGTWSCSGEWPIPVGQQRRGCKEWAR